MDPNELCLDNLFKTLYEEGPSGERCIMAQHPNGSLHSDKNGKRKSPSRPVLIQTFFPMEIRCACYNHLQLRENGEKDKNNTADLSRVFGRRNPNVFRNFQLYMSARPSFDFEGMYARMCSDYKELLTQGQYDARAFSSRLCEQLSLWEKCDESQYSRRRLEIKALYFQLNKLLTVSAIDPVPPVSNHAEALVILFLDAAFGPEIFIRHSPLFQKLLHHSYLDQKEQQILQPPSRALLQQAQPETVSSFMQRDSLLEEVQKQMEQHHQLFLYGIGGIGKTELARALAQKLQKQGIQVYWVHYHDSILNTIGQLACENYETQINGKPKTDQQIFRDKIRLLQRCRNSCLMIDDFFDDRASFREMAYQPGMDALSTLTIPVIFTTRYTVDSLTCHSGIEVPCMSEKELLLLIRTFYHPANPAAEEPELLSLIRAVKGHTLSVELIGKTLESQRGSISAGDILSALEETGTAPQTFVPVAVKKEQTLIEKDIFAFLRSMFHLQALTIPMKEALYLVSLFPNSGVNPQLCTVCLKDTKVLGQLVDRGWISRSARLSVHPLIRRFVFEELKAPLQLEQYLDELYALAERNFASSGCLSFNDLSQIAEALQTAIRHAEASDITKARWMYQQAQILGFLGIETKRMDCLERRCIRIRKQTVKAAASRNDLHSEELLELTNACSANAITWGKMGRAEHGIRKIDIAISLLEEGLRNPHIDKDPQVQKRLYAYKNTRAWLLGKAGDREGQLEEATAVLQRRAILNSKSSPADQRAYIRSLDNHAVALSYNGCPVEAYREMKKAIGNRESGYLGLWGHSHIFTAQACLELARIILFMDDSQRKEAGTALIEAEDAIADAGAICQELKVARTHPIRYKQYRQQARLYEMMGDIPSAAYACCEALESIRPYYTITSAQFRETASLLRRLLLTLPKQDSQLLFFSPSDFAAWQQSHPAANSRSRSSFVDMLLQPDLLVLDNLPAVWENAYAVSCFRKLIDDRIPAEKKTFLLFSAPDVLKKWIRDAEWFDFESQYIICAIVDELPGGAAE